MIALLYVAVIIMGYLLGSLPFGVIIGRVLGKTDIRTVGSGKTGMTNVMRVAGKKGAALSLIFDVGKGAAAVGLADLVFTTGYAESLTSAPVTAMLYAQVAAAFAAIAGHTWSVFLKFKGGRGVNTFLGGMMAMYWPAAIVGGAIMIIIGLISKYMSLGSITGAVVAFVMLIILNYTKVHMVGIYPYIQYVIYAMVGAIFIYMVHRDNIQRLVTGKERRIGEKANVENVENVPYRTD
jgi:glycerol-3-phosphate acyltransferase PlsY